MADELKFRLSAEDKATKALQGVNKKIDELKKGAGGVTNSFNQFTAALGKIAGPLAAISGGAIGFKKIGDAISEALDVAGEYETRFKTIEGVLNATGYAAGFTADEIRDMAQEIALGTLESTEGVERAAMKLATFKSIGGDAFRTVLELGTDLAALGFGSLEGNVVQLAKALEDPVRGMTALRRSGVSFSAEQEEVIKKLVETGDVAKAQALILEAVAGQVEGAGEAAARGLQGAWDTFGQKTEELNNEIGQLFSDISIAVANTGSALAQWATEQVQALAEVGQAWASLGRAITEHTTGIVQSLREVVNAALGIEDITSVGQKIDDLFVNVLNPFSDAAEGMFGKVVNAINPLSAALDSVGAVGRGLADIFTSSGERQRQAIESVNEAIEKQSAALGGIGSEIEKVAGGIKAQFDAVKNALSSATSEIDKLGKEIFNLNNSAEDFLLEMRGVDDVTRSWEEYKRVVAEIARVQKELANAEQDGDTERQIELKKELLELTKQAAQAAKDAGRDDEAVRQAQEHVEISKDLVGQLKEERSEQEKIAEQMRENLATMTEMVNAAEGVAEKLGMIQDEGGINLDIDMAAFEGQIGKLEKLIGEERQLEIGFDSLHEIKKELEKLDGLTLEASFQINSDVSEVEAQREQIQKDMKAGLTVDSDASAAEADREAVQQPMDATVSIAADASDAEREKASVEEDTQSEHRIDADASQAQKEKQSLEGDTESRHKVDGDTGDAQAKIRQLERDTSSTHTVYVREVKQNATGGLIGLAAGGFPRRRGRIHGPGTETSDSIPAMLSRGEYVIRASSVRKYGAALFDRLNRGLINDIPRFAAGGPVQPRDISAGERSDLPEMAINLSVQGGQPMRLTSSRATAKSLSNALRDLERAR
jgi:hypothetical protein